MVPLVIKASNILNVDEFEIFRLAHRYWNHHCADPSAISRAFAKYVQNRTVPPWVTHFSRRVVQAYHAKNFDPAIFGVYPAYERLPWSWSVALQTPRYVKLNRNCDVLAA